MNRSLLAAPAAVALLLTCTAGLAVAQEVTAPGPDSAECKAATSEVVSLETQVKIFTDGPPNTLSLVNLQAAVDAAIKADNETDPPLSKDSDATVAAKAALSARQGQIADLSAKLSVAVDKKTEACTEVTPPTGEPGPQGPSGEPGAPGPDGQPGTPGAPGPAFDDQDCGDFPTREAAQAKLDEDKADPHRLDSDGDGIGCEVGENENTSTVVNNDNSVNTQNNDNRVTNNGVTKPADSIPSGSVDTGWAA